MLPAPPNLAFATARHIPRPVTEDFLYAGHLAAVPAKDRWHEITFAQPIEQPVVVTASGPDGYKPQVRGVTRTGFFVRNASESPLGWIAGRAGQYTLSTGARICLGSSGADMRARIPLDTFDRMPMVFAQVHAAQPMVAASTAGAETFAFTPSPQGPAGLSWIALDPTPHDTAGVSLITSHDGPRRGLSGHVVLKDVQNLEKTRDLPARQRLAWWAVRPGTYAMI